MSYWYVRWILWCINQVTVNAVWHDVKWEPFFYLQSEHIPSKWENPHRNKQSHHRSQYNHDNEQMWPITSKPTSCFQKQKLRFRNVLQLHLAKLQNDILSTKIGQGIIVLLKQKGLIAFPLQLTIFFWCYLQMKPADNCWISVWLASSLTGSQLAKIKKSIPDDMSLPLN